MQADASGSLLSMRMTSGADLCYRMQQGSGCSNCEHSLRLWLLVQIPIISLLCAVAFFVFSSGRLQQAGLFCFWAMPRSHAESSGAVSFDEDEIGFAGMAEAWEQSAVVRNRFRRNLPWLQYPIPKREEIPEGEGKEKEDVDNKGFHAPSTRALELNVETLSGMLDVYGGEFIDIDHLTKEAWLAKKDRISL